MSPLAAVATALVGIGLGVLAGWLLLGASSATPGGSAQTTPIVTVPPPPPPPPPPPAPSARDRAIEAALGTALREGIRAVARDGLGTVEAAVMLDGSREPVVRGVRRGRSMRVWSMVKVVTAVTLLRAREAGSAGLERTLSHAFVRSENCAQRKLVLELQKAARGMEAAKAMLRETMRRAGGRLDTRRAQRSRSGAVCRSPRFRGMSARDAARPALLVGTTQWTVADAARFAHALRGRTTYGEQVSDEVLALMRRPKRLSREPGADNKLTAPPEWGAGTTFRAACWHAAYKGGWGLNATTPYVAGQLGAVDLPGGRWVAFAVMFHPYKQPPDSDPGKARAPRALQTVLDGLRRELRKEFASACGR